MHNRLSLSVVPMALALSAAGPPAPARADEIAIPDRATLLAENAPGLQHGNGFGIVTVSAPQPLPTGKATVTLWDEIPPSPQLPMPLPVPQPGDAQHAMQGSAPGNTRQ
ncbi:hypothetical protein DIE03_31080 [Burkholderia sp. Bp8992]|uniref:hypothetical protein n=1 Tax=unclassified Burkholderia TaxID=2613784 RepID=UPI000F568666|nr:MULTISPECIES: hypothetical protein [unclassified Burkholderia]RQS21764.1 hypothetical protein DIE03_31080 [Burkholderia sp. Bp8992]